MAQVRLVLDKAVDDHPRGKHPLARRLLFPTTQIALLLYVDGTVIETDQVLELPTPRPDAVVGGGHEWVGEDDSWEATVLDAAGYTLEPAL